MRNNLQWQALCHVIGQDELARRSNLATAARRHRASHELNEIVAAWCRGISAAEAEGLLQARGVPAVRVRGIHDLVRDVHLAERGAFRHLGDGSWTTTLPWIADGGWRGEYSPTPPLGSHNSYVLGDILGLSADRQEDLRSAGVIR